MIKFTTGASLLKVLQWMVCIKSRMLLGQRSAGSATWSTLNSQPPQLFKDWAQQEWEINHLHNEEHVSCPQTAAAKGFFKLFCCLTCWIPQPGLKSWSPKPPNSGRALLQEEKFIASGRGCVWGAASPVLTAILSTSLRLLDIPCTLLPHQRPDPTEHWITQSPFTDKPCLPLQKFSESCDLSLTWLKSSASSHSVCSHVYIISNEFKN